MASVTQVQELKDRYEGNLTVRYSDTYLQVKLEDAEAMIAQDYPTVAVRLASGALLKQNYTRIVCDAVLRIVRNPEGFTSEGEGGVTLARNPTVSSGDLWLTDREVATLTGIRVTDSRVVPGSVSLGVDAGWGS